MDILLQAELFYSKVLIKVHPNPIRRPGAMIKIIPRMTRPITAINELMPLIALPPIVLAILKPSISYSPDLVLRAFLAMVSDGLAVRPRCCRAEVRHDRGWFPL